MADSYYQVIQDGTNWSIVDVASGTVISTFTNRGVADQLAASGDFSAANIEKSIYQDINYQSGIQTTADTSTANTTGTPTVVAGDTAISGSQIVDEAGTVSQFQRNEYGDLYQPLVPPSVTSIQTAATEIPEGQALNEYGDLYSLLPPVPLSEIQSSNSATAGLTTAQLAALGGADPTDPFIRARLDLPVLGTGVPNLVDSIVSNLPSFSSITPTTSSIKTSAENTFGDIADFFSNTTTTDVPLSSIQTNSIIPDGQTVNDYGDSYTPLPPVPLSEIQTTAELNIDEGPTQLSGPADSELQVSAEAQDESTYQQFVQAFSEADVQTGPAPFEPTAGINNIPLVPVATVGAGQVDPEVDPGAAEPVTEALSDDSVQLDANQVDPTQDPSVFEIEAEDLPVSEDAFVAEPVDPDEDPTVFTVDEPVPDDEEPDAPELLSEEEAQEQQLVPEPDDEIPVSEINTGPSSLTPEQLDAIAAAQGVDAGNTDPEAGITDAQLFANESAAQEASVTQGFLDQARQQQTISSQRKQVNNGDWRVRLRLAPMAKYLYNAPSPGILQPLKVSDGVIFPYTPSIDTAYKADYDAYSLTHSNYKGYFYKGSYVDAINLKCTFTAQSTAEANYLLAVITFFKSVTKMFYGQDAERGAPPPLTYLSGLGEYQFNEHPCLVQQFTYNLPADVDYIRANSTLNVGLNQITQRDRQTVATASNFGGLNRLAAAALTKGAIPSPLPPPTLGTNNPTYVPTKIDISITLLPVQSRSQVSKQFSLKSFANGDLIKGGFW